MTDTGAPAQQQQQQQAPFDAMAAIQVLIEKAQADGEPQRIGHGMYSLYATPQGGLHLVYCPDGMEDQHLPIPPAILAALASGGNPIAIARNLLGR